MQPRENVKVYTRPVQYMAYDYHKHNYYPEIDHKGPMYLLALFSVFTLLCAGAYWYLTT